MGGASHGSSRPVRTFPFDLITLNHFAHIFYFFSWLFNFLYVTCVMVNKAVTKNHTLKNFCSRLFLIVDKFPNQQKKSEVTCHNSIQRCGLLTI